MKLSPFHAFYKARLLSNYAFGKNKLIPAFASSNIKIFPYQIAAALFALRSPYQKGVILCDDGALGKTFEALLIVVQKWYEGKQRTLIIVPTPLLGQWQQILEEYFSIPYMVVDNQEVFEKFEKSKPHNPFVQEAIILTTYDFAAEKADTIEEADFQTVVFEEAHYLRRIYTGKNKTLNAIQKATADSFKILLTATPMQNSILDLYGLIQFIDDGVFTDEDAFYNRYFRKPENYGELAERVRPYCFRTMRSQVQSYVKIPERIIITAEYSLSDAEHQLYSLLDAYIHQEQKVAFPQMDQYELALMLFRTFSSSSFALAKTLNGIVTRLAAQLAKDTEQRTVQREYEQIKQMLDLAESIEVNAKGAELLNALDLGFKKLKEVRANQKALIFTENKTTQKYLFQLLNEGKYKNKVLLFSGDTSRDYTIMGRFEKEAQILIATDSAAEGFHLPFCSFVINYDLPYNTLKVEQRINRCHRQGQQSDVLIVNFLNRNNFADVRMLELVNKRILQFGGIFGLSDHVLGNIGVDLTDSFAHIMGKARTKDEIEKAYQETLELYEDENKQIVQQAEHTLFSSFTKEVADNIDITPEYIEQEIESINNDLWAVTKYFFEPKYQFILNDETRTVSCLGSPPKVFTGAHMGRNEYSMAKDYQPRSGRHTITGALARNIIQEIFWTGIPDKGYLIVDGQQETCRIGYYEIQVKGQNDFMGGYRFYAFIGQYQNGMMLSDEECRVIMALPVVDFKSFGETYGGRDGNKEKSPEPLDNLINSDEFIQRALNETELYAAEEAKKLKAYYAEKIRNLEKDVDAVKRQLKVAEKALAEADSRLEQMKLQKQANVLLKEAKQKESGIYFERLGLEQACEDRIQELLEQARLTATVTRQFIIDVKGNVE